MNEKIAEYIEALAQQLGVAVTHLYGVMVRQMVAEGITYGLLNLAFVIAIPIIAYKLARLTIRKWDVIYRADMEGLVIPAWIFGGIAAAVILIGSAIGLPDAIMHVINPEYYVVREILDAVKN